MIRLSSSSHQDRNSTGSSRHYLSNDHLLVELADVTWPRRPRFDRTGFITQVTLKDNGRTYCAYELDVADPDAGGGLCGEFGIMRPIGYDEAAAGDWFMKPGVGLLQKLDDSPYDFFRDYPIQPYDIQVDLSEAEVRYKVLPKLCRGYAIDVTKTITLEDNGLVIGYEATNCGDKLIDTHEYVHNFLRIDGYPIGPDYSLGFSFPIKADFSGRDYHPIVIQSEDEDIQWTKTPEKPFYFRLQPEEGKETASWKLTHKPSGGSITEECMFPLELVAVWGTTHTVSPEMFITVRLEPGESATWKRKYRFY